MNSHSPRKRTRKFLSIIAVLALNAGIIVPATVMAANPSATLDQCANGSDLATRTSGCNTAAADWVNGNLGASKSAYQEGDSIPYRMTFGNLPLSSHTVTIEWDTTKSGTHALDYLTTFNRTVGNANPCLGISGCAASTTFPIPADPQVTGAGVTPIAGNFTFYGGAITGVSAYSYANGAGFVGDKSARITITFTPTQANPVLAWGGHISTRVNWGALNSAVAIPGSPYHTRLIDLDGSGGNQDRSLSAAAVVFPGSITIVKDADPNDAQDFAFSTTGGLSPSTFSLDDDSNGDLSNTQAYAGVTNFTTYTVVEGAATGWALSFQTPVCTVGTPNGGTQGGNVGTRTLTINLAEGENVTCTFVNTRQSAHLIIIKEVTNNNGGSAQPSDFSGTITGVTASDGNTWTGTASPGVDKTLTAVGSYNVTENAATGYTPSYSTDCTGSIAFGETKTCTINNNDNAPALHLRKTITNDNGGGAAAIDWTLTATGTGASPTNLSGTTPVDSTATFKADTYALGESGPTGYTAGAWNCGAASMPDATHVTVPLGGNVTCTINNNDNAPALHLRKTITNDNGGGAAAIDWTLTATGTGASPTNLSGTTPVDSTATFKADTYALGESGPTGYTAGAWNCGAASMPDATHVTVPLGGNVTCTINNNDNAPALHLRKTITNDNGGGAAAIDWTLTATGTGASPTNLSGTTPVDSTATFKADTYALGESGPTGYTAGAWNCGAASMPDATHVTVPLGGNVTCTINNNDNAPALHLRKTITNDNGGGAAAIDWTLTATGTGASPTNLSGTTPVDSTATFKADTYALGESGPTGYTAGAWNCGAASMPDATHVTVPLGGNVTCTINNNDTKASPSGTTVQKWVLHDTMTIVGIRHGAGDEGTARVTFRLYSDDSCATQEGSDEVVTISAAGVASTVTGVTVTDTGLYYWRAQYSGDAFNTGFTTACGVEITEIHATDEGRTEVLFTGAIGAGFAIPLLLLGFWNRKRRQIEA